MRCFVTFIFYILFLDAGNTFDNIMHKRYLFFILGSVYILDTIRLNPISVGNMYPKNLNKRFITTFLNNFFSYYLLHHPGVLEILDLDLKDYHHFTNLGTFVFNFILIYLSI